ncbi:MAG: LamG-like jellyroll fold domain-containing protein [Chthoniobacterales bacterium]
MTASTTPYAPFVHPGALHTEADFDRMKAKIAAGTAPWKTSYDQLTGARFASTGWGPTPAQYINRGGTAADNYTRAQWDAQSLYELSLRWKLTGDVAYANQAVWIANAWSGTLLGITGDSNQSLASGICGYLFATGGEILSTYPGWPAAQKQAYKDMMMRVFYIANEEYLWYHFGTPVNAGGNTHYRLNWDADNLASMAAIGILCDNRAVYQQAVDYFKFGSGNGRVERAAWYIHPDGTSQTEESGRDQFHNEGGWYSMGLLCQMAWNQGDDLFGYDNNRVLRAYEYIAKYNLGNDDVSWVYHSNTDTATNETLSSTGRWVGNYPAWELVYNHYANVQGVAAPWSKIAMNVIRPEGFPTLTSPASAADSLGLGSLTYARDDTTTSAAPSGLLAQWSKNQLILNWWGSPTATSYQIQRTASGASAAGPYATLGTAVEPNLNFTDTTVVNGGSYYYKVVAITPTGNLESPPLLANQALVASYSFEGNTNDGTGTRHATAGGGVTAPGYAAGFGGGQAISLNGTDQYVQLPVNSGLSRDVTLAGWVYWNGGNANQRVFDFGSEIEKFMMLTVKNGSGKLQFQMTTSRVNNGTITLVGPTMPTATWTHLAVTFNGETATLYVNGKPVASGSSPRLAPMFSQPFCYLGRSMWNPDAYFSGRIDNFRIANYGMTGKEIYNLWGQGGANAAPVFTANPIKPVDATQGINYSGSAQTLASLATDANGGTLTYSKVTGPAWLTVASNGALSGTPANGDVGVNAFVVRVTDSSGATDDANLYITVANVNDAPTWSTNPIYKLSVTQNIAYIGTLANDASDVDVGDTISFSKVSGPAWLAVAANGTLSGTPAAANVGVNSFVVRATDSSGAFNDATLTISVLAPALQTRFLLDGSASDSLGATTATLTGTPSYGTGVFNQSLLLDGTTNYVTLGTLSGMTYNDFTVATWVYWNGGNAPQRIFDFGSGTDEYIYLTPSNGSNMRFLIRENGVDQYVDTAPLPKNQWVHVAVTLNGSTATIYVNGVAKASNSAVTNEPANISLTLNYIGKSQYASDPLLNGQIDDFRLYNYALSASEVTALLSGVPAIMPTGVLAVPASSKITLTWNTSATAQSYSVKRGTTSGGPYTTIASGLTATNYTDTSGLSIGVTYYYVVSATNTLGESANSDEDSVVLSDLIAYLKLDETSGTTAADSSGNGFDATLVNTPTRISGLYGNAVNLASGSSQYATLPAGVMNGQTDFTLSAWVKLGSISTWARIFDFGTGTTNYMFLCPAPSTANKMRFAIRTPSVTEQQINSGTIVTTTGVWTHVAVTLSGSVGTLYINGVVAGTNSAMTLTPSSLGSTTLNYIGKSQFNDPYLNGAVDEFRIYNRALTAAEVLAQATPAPTVPAALTATGNDGYVTLSWPQADAATSYTVKRATVSGGPYATVTNGSAVTATTFLDTGLTNGSTYYYVVSANNWLGSSADSTEAFGIPYAISWSGQDIGAVAAAGSSSYATGTYTVIGSGADIWSTLDEFYFRSVLVGGDCSLTARVVSVQNTNAWAKAGVMVRSSLAANASNAAVLLTPTTTNGVTWQTRTTDGGTSASSNTTGIAPPYWVRVVRAGNTLQGYRSADGSTWVSTGSATITLGTNVYIGLAVTSHLDGTPCTATFDNVTLVSLPVAPAALTATAGYQAASLGWTASDGATSYNIKRALVSGGPYTVLATGVSALSYADANLTAGTTYYYVVSPVNAAGEGLDSPEASVIPLTPGTTVTFNSASAQDGYVRESSETSNAGGTITSTSLRIGDDSSDRQYKTIVSFDTSSIPDDATIISATLKMRRSGGSGTNPFTTHGTCYVDVKSGSGYSASTTLQIGDFEATADVATVATMSNAASTGAWSTGSLNQAGRGLINKTGTTQCRVYFTLDDNDDRGNDYVSFNSGEDSASGYAPVLEVTYNQDAPGMQPNVSLHFNETTGTTAADSSGNGWNGTLVNGPAWTTGKFANAVSLDGTNDHVTLPAGVVSSLNDCTISAWVKLNSVTAWTRIFDFGTGTANYMLLTPTNGSGVRFAIKTTPSAEQVITGNTAIAAGAWTHVAVVLSGSTGTLYVNGVSVGTNTAMTLRPSSLGATTLNYLGRSQFSADPYLNGVIDEFQIHGYAMSVSEITALATPPAAPTGVIATAGDALVATIWNASTRATGYNVKCATTSGGPYTTAAAGVTTTAFSDSGLTNGTTYYYVVSALNAIGESANSAETSARPLSAVQTWRQTYFGMIDSVSTAADTADPDGDGWTNAQEFLTGTDPTNATSTLKISELQVSGNDFVVSFPSVSGKTYRVERSDTLQAGSWTTLLNNIAGTGGVVQITDAGGATQSKHFYRVVLLP